MANPVVLDVLATDGRRGALQAMARRVEALKEELGHAQARLALAEAGAEDAARAHADLPNAAAAAAAEPRACRICLEAVAPTDAVHLGCACRGDLELAHRDCAVSWFRTRTRGRAEGAANEPDWAVEWFATCEVCNVPIAKSIVLQALRAERRRIEESKRLDVDGDGAVEVVPDGPEPPTPTQPLPQSLGGRGHVLAMLATVALILLSIMGTIALVVVFGARSSEP